MFRNEQLDWTRWTWAPHSPGKRSQTRNTSLMRFERPSRNPLWDPAVLNPWQWAARSISIQGNRKKHQEEKTENSASMEGALGTESRLPQHDISVWSKDWMACNPSHCYEWELVEGSLPSFCSVRLPDSVHRSQPYTKQELNHWMLITSTRGLRR